MPECFTPLCRYQHQPQKLHIIQALVFIIPLMTNNTRWWEATTLNYYHQIPLSAIWSMGDLPQKVQVTLNTKIYASRLSVQIWVVTSRRSLILTQIAAIVLKYLNCLCELRATVLRRAQISGPEQLRAPMSSTSRRIVALSLKTSGPDPKENSGALLAFSSSPFHVHADLLQINREV